MKGERHGFLRQYRKTSILLLLFASIGLTCRDIKTTDFQIEASTKKSMVLPKVCIGNINLPENYDGDRLLWQNLMQTNLKVLLEDSGRFQEVSYCFNNQKESNISLEYDFRRWKNESGIYPGYYPLAFLSATLYVWFGGPILEGSLDYEVRVLAKDRNGKILNSTSRKGEWSYTEGVWNIDKHRSQLARLRGDFLLGLTLNAVEGL